MHPPDADLQTRLTGRRPPRWAWLLALLLPLVASAQVPAPEAPDLVLAASAKYRSIKQLAEETEAHGRSRLVELVGQLDGIRLTASQCADDAAAGLARLARQSAALNLTGKPASATAAPGEPGKPPAAPPVPDTTAAELPGLATLRAELAAQRAALESREATCRLLELNSTELSSELSRREQQLAASALLVRTPDVLQVVRQNLGQVHQWSVAGTTLLRLVTGVEELGWIHFGGLLAVSLLAALLAGTWRRQPLRAEDSQGTLPFTTHLVLALRSVLRAQATPLLVLLAINLYLAVLELQGGSDTLYSTLTLGALLLLLLAMSARLLLDPPPPAHPLLTTRPGEGQRICRLLQLLALLFLVGLLLRELRELQVLDLAMQRLLSDVYVVLLAANVLPLLRYVGRGSSGTEKFVKRGLPALALLAIVAASWLGYRELARFLFWASVGTATGLLAVVLVSRLIDDLQDSLDSGRYGWQRALRRLAGLSPSESVPGLGWLALLLQIGLWGLLAVYLLKLWGLPQQVMQQGQRLFVEGIEIGSVNIVPSRIAWAVLALVLAMMVTRWVQARLEHRWLLRTRMERGAREAVATSFGYAGIAAAVLLTLSMAGIDFSNLALIAGALSVGIGFGLQNVVNNFVSGLIMLFERPVKTGDWIVVGNTEGYVRRISIRTTTIQTFDRADVIVPNSELISNQVTNWMHSNTYGRFKVPVGVAYGSDTEKVRELLLRVAREHPQVVRGFPSWPDPWVLFLGFGDSSLNFELRGIVYNVDQRLGVVSDLNFAIDRVFREQRIEIPFPQRVVHLAPGAAAGEPATAEPPAARS